MKMSLGGLQVRGPVWIVLRKWQLLQNLFRLHQGVAQQGEHPGKGLENLYRSPYTKYNYPRKYNFFNELFAKVEKNITSAGDLEKFKTENLLRELDELLKNPDTKKKWNFFFFYPTFLLDKLDNIYVT